MSAMRETVEFGLSHLRDALSFPDRASRLFSRSAKILFASAKRVGVVASRVPGQLTAKPRLFS